MKSIFRPVLCLHFVLIAAVLALSLPMHMARAGAMQIEICGEFGPELRWIDGAGEPVPAPRECIKCMLCKNIMTLDRAQLVPEQLGGVLFTLDWPMSAAQVASVRLDFYAQPQGPPFGAHVAHETGIEINLETLDESHLCQRAGRFQNGKAAA